jgi:hypothetical protein
LTITKVNGVVDLAQLVFDSDLKLFNMFVNWRVLQRVLPFLLVFFGSDSADLNPINKGTTTLYKKEKVKGAEFKNSHKLILTRYTA